MRKDMHHAREPIAIVGSACRFAGGTNSPSQLWELLQKPRDLLREIPESRFNPDGFYHADGSRHSRTSVKHAYFLDESLGAFDAEFFGIKPVEAKAMDPQQRFLMEVVYEALENAGMPLQDLKGSNTGVYVGTMGYDYSTLIQRDISNMPTYSATGTAPSILANRLSYFFNWHGPSIALDTACSSSLVAVHLAVQALRSGECTLALACGSNLILSPETFIIESKLGMLSPDGRSRMWDQGANGYARGEGVGALVLKPLSAALRDNDVIESIIRETCINQDGASKSTGITIPNPSAQEALIRATYAKAGLDLRKREDRPQFFEAHGTGTLVGDPAEAEAIYNALTAEHNREGSQEPPLYVGSIKTVLGHTEGTAGIAAIMKVSQAIKRGFVPPNMLFNQLSSRVAPFFIGLEIPLEAKPWPELASDGGTRRASVNSFGFGGTNAHAILESYDKTSTTSLGPMSTFAPYVFSACSTLALREGLAAYAAFFDQKGPEINPRDLSWTLRSRRSTFPYRIAFPSSSVENLSAKISAKLEEGLNVPKTLPSSKRGRILGIFTGQGAQYPRMGAELIESSAAAASIIENLEKSLRQLPDGPAWSLKAELLADATSSRVREAAVSQPLCTAVQILLVDLMRLAGVEFSTVVGHSSGEIAAAYAAKFITAEDAIRIAYYRGACLQYAASPKGQDVKGAMVAVSSSAMDLEELCNDRVFSGRVHVAAFNSPSSFTMSGDEEMITELEILFADEGKFHRRLRVDKAYHSNHMLPCCKPYVDYLTLCDIQSQQPTANACTWISSVHGHCMDSTVDLSGEYWAENMARPVLFSQALSEALQLPGDAYDLVVEIGAHSALKGPSMQTMQNNGQPSPSYTGTLERGKNAVEAMSAALGFCWAHIESNQVDLDAYERILSGTSDGYCMVTELPTYSWNHETEYWHESRASRRLRSRNTPSHCLLGDATPDSAAHQRSWRNMLRINDLGWLSGHRVQGQVVFPASGYLATALEAARSVAEGMKKIIRRIELSEFIVHRAIAFDRDDTGVEVLTQVCGVELDGLSKRIRATFTYSAALSSSSDELLLVASANMETLVESISPMPSATLLPRRNNALAHMIDVETDRFYQALAELGYEFSGAFKSLYGLQRRHQISSCKVKQQKYENLLIHPVDLDAVLQSCILAYSHPYDNQLRTLHLPTRIQRVRVDPVVLLETQSNRDGDSSFTLDAVIHPQDSHARGISGDVNLYSNVTSQGAIQVQDATFMPICALGESDDRNMFLKVHWVRTALDGSAAAESIRLTAEHQELLLLLERIATFYARKFDRMVNPEDPIRMQFPLNYYLNYCRHLTATMESGNGKWGRPEWLQDTPESILEASRPYTHVVDVEMMHLVGNQMPRVFRGETTMLEQFRSDECNGILDRYYADGYGLKESAQWIGRAVKQICDRYPYLEILEIGAGTGAATKAIFREIDRSFSSYTYTDVSPAFFENASNVFSRQRDRMNFTVFDVENSPSQQGFTEGSFGLAVAFFILHATSDLGNTLRNIRRLLRPGGFLVVGEGNDGDSGLSGNGFIFGTLPGWWLGAGKQGRSLSPFVTPTEWDRLLRATGFSGIDVGVPASWNHTLKANNFVAQAVDDQVQFLREPLLPSAWRVPRIGKLVIVGGQTSRTARLVKGLEVALGGTNATDIHTVGALTDLSFDTVADPNTTVLSLTEIDKPIFDEITPTVFESLRRLFETGRRIFWVTSGRLESTPLSNMIVGFGRVAANESPDLRLQHLDLLDVQGVDPRTIAGIFLRFYASEHLSSSLLWFVEPEIMLDARGQQFSHRLLPIPELNDRYNSTGRAITRERTIAASPVVVHPSAQGYVIRDMPALEESVVASHAKPDDLLRLHTCYATSSAVKTPAGYNFVLLGTRPEDNAMFLSLTSSLCSVNMVSPKSVVQVEVAPEMAPSLLATVAVHLVAMAVVNSLCDGQTILLHNASDSFSHCFTTQASSRDLAVISIAASAETSYHMLKLAVQFPHLPAGPGLIEALPSEVGLYVNLGDDDFAMADSERDIITKLPTHCRVESTRTLFSRTASAVRPSSTHIFSKILNTALQSAQSPDSAALPVEHSVVDLKSIANETPAAHPLSVIKFSPNDVVSVQSSRLDRNQIFKGANSTYWIVGMTGELGVSVCDWMIKKGARNVAIASRRPNISPDWIAAHNRRGTRVMVLSCDVTKENEVLAAHRKICESLPPIVGVMNGAMVLHDVAIRNMTFQQLVDVTRPKVDGSIYLDRLFHNTDLDFFLLISSINCIVGSWGQANYAAANMFMCALAAKRRKRGLRASAVNVGAIIGAGYMARESRRALDALVDKLHLMRLSEEDWHQAISEAIDAGRLESPHGPEITMGLLQVPADVPAMPIWFSNPRFSGFLAGTRRDTGYKKDKVAETSLQDVLRACSSREDLCNVVTRAFADQLRSILQLDKSDEDLMSSRSSEIGLDSLVSIDIRSWFLKNLHLSMPILRIMGNNTMQSLVEFAVDTMPATLTPRIDEVAGQTIKVASAKVDVGDENGLKLSGSDGSVSEELGLSTPSRSKSLDFGGTEKIDWVLESTPPASWALLLPDSTSPPLCSPKVIVLTGATGLLGHHLLDNLLKHTSAKMIHCLAVRGLERRLQDNDLITDPRVKYYTGSLSDPLLGLSEEQANFIFASADVVIHNGTDTSHTKSYLDLKDSNVGSTITLAGLCIPRRIPFHYISSAGVALYYNRPVFPEVSVGSPEALPILADGAFGYGCSKWVNEQLLEAAQKQFGLPVCIYRPSTIVREGADMSTARAQLDWVNMLLRYIRKLQAAPKMEHNHGMLDLVRVETCCAHVVHGTTKGSHSSQAGPRYMHLVGDDVLQLDCLGNIDATKERLYKTVPLWEWIDIAVRAGLHPGVAKLIGELDIERTGSYPRLLRSGAA
ncbi:putative polyketide synthase [Stachybotrys elegans]|uniref:Polyketide synthase n=1 Tax=Stachybotrys elegans TaxID=80388 RepID=A0A8K0WQM7_9HYPO|nr:putative polyketide synthase [Stachybotrys elegans]